MGRQSLGRSHRNLCQPRSFFHQKHKKPRKKYNEDPEEISHPRASGANTESRSRRAFPSHHYSKHRIKDARNKKNHGRRFPDARGGREKAGDGASEESAEEEEKRRPIFGVSASFSPPGKAGTTCGHFLGRALRSTLGHQFASGGPAGGGQELAGLESRCPAVAVRGRGRGEGGTTRRSNSFEGGGGRAGCQGQNSVAKQFARPFSMNNCVYTSFLKHKNLNSFPNMILRPNTIKHWPRAVTTPKLSHSNIIYLFNGEAHVMVP